MKYAFNKCWKNFLGAFFWGPIRVSQMGLTGGGQFGQNGQKLHENDKIHIFGSKQWGDKPIF